MSKLLAALGLAVVAVPVALATPALAEPSVTVTPSVSSVLRQHEGFRAEVTYRCTDPEREEGTINVLLQQAKPGAGSFETVARARDEARCDGDEREEKIRIPVASGAVQADQLVRLYTTLIVNGHQVAMHTSAAEPVADSLEPTPSPSATATESESPSPSPSPSETESPSPSPSPSESESPTSSPSPSEPESPTSSPSPSGSASPTSSPSPSEPESASTETPSPSPTATP